MTPGRAPSGPAFWIGASVGAAIMGFGVDRPALATSRVPRCGSWLKTFLGALRRPRPAVRPARRRGRLLLVRVVPARARAPVQVAAIVSGALIAVSIPVVGGFGRLANNPSLLPSEPTARACWRCSAPSGRSRASRRRALR